MLETANANARIEVERFKVPNSILHAQSLTCKPFGCKREECCSLVSSLNGTLQEYAKLEKSRNMYFKMLDDSIKINQRWDDERAKGRGEKLDVISKQNALICDLKNAIARLRYDLQVLHEQKTDPYGRDEVVMQLKEKIASKEGREAFLNNSLYNCNLDERIAKDGWEAEKKANEELRKEHGLLKLHNNQLIRVNEALKEARPEELKTLSFTGQCRDYPCAKRFQRLWDSSANIAREINDLKLQLQTTEHECQKARADAETWRQEYSRVLQQQITVKDANGEEAVVMEQTPVVQYIELEPKQTVADQISCELQMRIQSFFSFDYTRTAEADEGNLYDLFMDDQEPEKRMHVLDLMYAACHQGQTMPEKDKHKYKGDDRKKGKSRMFKSCFSACLRGLNGISKRKGTKLVWTNIHPKREPNFSSDTV